MKHVLEAIEPVGRKWDDELMAVVRRMQKIAPDMNPDSQGQVRYTLYDYLDLKPIGRGRRSTSVDREQLQHLGKQHVLPRLLLQYREIRQKYQAYKMFREHIARELEGEG